MFAGIMIALFVVFIYMGPLALTILVRKRCHFYVCRLMILLSTIYFGSECLRVYEMFSRNYQDWPFEVSGAQLTTLPCFKLVI